MKTVPTKIGKKRIKFYYERMHEYGNVNHSKVCNRFTKLY